MFLHATVVKWQSLLLHMLFYDNLPCTTGTQQYLCDFVQGIGSTGESTISVVPSGIHFSTQENQDLLNRESEVYLGSGL